MLAMPASPSRWAWDRSGQLTTQWLSIPQLKKFFLPKLLAIIFPISSFLPGTGWGFLSIKTSLATAAAFSAIAAAVVLPFCAKAMPPPCLPPPGWRCW